MPADPIRITFIRSTPIARETMAFYFAKPDGFAFKAGQYGDFEVIDPQETDTGGNIRTFSLASAPHEPELMIATRMQDSAYKRALRALQPGDSMTLRSFGGSFALHNKHERPAVMIAGGIGITMFRSLLLDAAERGLPHQITLVYSNRTADDAAFLEDLERAQKKNHNFKFAHHISKERGRITADTLQEYADLKTNPIYYIVGSMGMVSSVRDMLEAMGVDSDDIRTEEFPGY